MNLSSPMKVSYVAVIENHQMNLFAHLLQYHVRSYSSILAAISSRSFCPMFDLESL